MREMLRVLILIDYSGKCRREKSEFFPCFKIKGRYSPLSIHSGRIYFFSTKKIISPVVLQIKFLSIISKSKLQKKGKVNIGWKFLLSVSLKITVIKTLQQTCFGKFQGVGCPPLLLRQLDELPLLSITATRSFAPDPHRETTLRESVKDTSSGCTRFRSRM